MAQPRRVSITAEQRSINKNIAVWRGWSPPSRETQLVFLVDPATVPVIYPDYCGDMDLVQSARDGFTDDQWDRYIKNVSVQVGSGSMKSILSAPALIHARAIEGVIE